MVNMVLWTRTWSCGFTRPGFSVRSTRLVKCMVSLDGALEFSRLTTGADGLT